MRVPPLSLYIHTPWCVRKCPYCDFNSHQRDEIPEQAYLDALLADLAQDLPLVGERPVETVFIGGGTPSLLSPAFYQALFAALRQRLNLLPDAEVTLEANPGTLESGRFEGFRAASINRLSIGVQSFNETHLQALGRIHDSHAAIRAAGEARAAGFDNFNLDIMHALPGQTPAQAMADLEQAIALAPTHLSWYELTIEPNTAFYRSPPQQPDLDMMADTEAEGFAKLAEAGYQRYEISAFSRPGRACRHNLNYWQFGDYLGIGAGAHGKLTLPKEERILRYQKTRLPEHYLKAPGQSRRQETAVTEDEGVFEALLNGLRLLDGVPLEDVEARTGQPASQWLPALAPLFDQQLLERFQGRLRCPPRALPHLNGILEKIAERL